MRLARARFAIVPVALAAFALGMQSTPSVGGGPLPSGGKAVAHKAGGKKVSKPGKAPVAQLFSVGYPAGEPTLAITKNGDIFFPSINVYETNHVEVLKSSNGGAKWTEVSPRLGAQNRHAASLDPYVYVDEDTGRLFNIDLTVACSILSFSDDEGKSWTTNPLACGRPVNDHQTLFGGPPVDSPTVGYENLVYYCWNDVASTSCSKSLDGGLSFHPTGGPVFAGMQPSTGKEVPFCGGLAGHGVVDQKGVVYLPKESCLQPWLGISRDEGKTWENVRISKKSAGDGILDPSVAVDRAGNVYYAWTGGDRHIYLSVSKNGGKKWSKPVVVDAPKVREANIGTITVGKPGNVAIAYYGSENSPWKDSCDGNDKCDTYEWTDVTWNGYMTVTKNALAKGPTFFSANVNPKNDPLMRGHCGPGRCQNAFDFIDVVLHPDGTPYATFVDGCYELCNAKMGSSGNGNKGLVARMKGIKLR
jgi:BNR repeat-like domain